MKSVLSKIDKGAIWLAGISILAIGWMAGALFTDAVNDVFPSPRTQQFILREHCTCEVAKHYQQLKAAEARVDSLKQKEIGR